MKVVEPGNKHKMIACPHCEAILDYLPRDIETKYIDYFDNFDISKYIICPECERKISLDVR